MALFPTGNSADTGDAVPFDYWRKAGTLLNTGASSFYNVKNDDFGAVGNGTTDDYTAVAAAVAACPAGGTVLFPPGTYKLGQPLTIPKNITLAGTHAPRWPYDGGTPSTLQPASTGFNGTTLLRIKDKEEGGYSSEQDGIRLRGLSLNGLNATGTGAVAIDGLYATGAVRDLRLQNVCIYNFTGRGVHTNSYTRVDTSKVFPKGWELSHVVSWGCTQEGMLFDNTVGAAWGISDAEWDDVLVGASSSDGLVVSGSSDNHFRGCRCVFNAGYGYRLVGDNGSTQWSGCSTDRNGKSGWYLNSNQSRHPVVVSGCIAKRDGSSGAGYAGFEVVGTAAGTPHPPLVLSGSANYVSKDDGGTGNASPDYGLKVTNGRQVAVGGSVLMGLAAPILDPSNAVSLDGASRGNTTDSALATTYDVVAPGTSIWGPEDMGYLVWNTDPGICVNSQILTSGTVYLCRVAIRRALRITNLHTAVATAGATLTSGQSSMGLYKTDGTTLTLLSATGDMSGDFASTGPKSKALTTAQNITPGYYYVAIVSNGTTPPTLPRTTNVNNTWSNIGNKTAADARFATNGTATTALPGTLTAASNNAATGPIDFWVGVS